MDTPQKRLAAIHSLAGFGKCSMTIILPVLASAGIEVCPLPTAVLSSHTGGLPGLHCRDLTDDLLPAANQWKSLGLRFDCVYSGYLGSPRQIEIVGKIFDLISGRDTLKIVDPCMADNGKLYSTYTPEMAAHTRELCQKADLILPNLTEAALLLGEPYRPEKSGDMEYLKGLLNRLSAIHGGKTVLTGITRGEFQTGAVCLSEPGGIPEYAFAEKKQGHHHGTGDLFAGVLIAGLFHGFSLREAALLAAEFVSETIERTNLEVADERYGIRFEAGIPLLLERLRKKESLS